MKKTLTNTANHSINLLLNLYLTDLPTCSYPVIVLLYYQIPVIISAIQTARINLSPFTKDFRVWGALTEIFLICLKTDLFGGQSTKLLSWNDRHNTKSDDNC